MEKTGNKRPWKSQERFPLSHSSNNKLDDRDHFQQNAKTSVASLRGLIGSSRNIDRHHSGMLIDFIGIPRDFWSDAKFPLTGPGGIIFVEGSDQRIGETEGFGLLVLFLLAFGGGWRKGKFKASSTGMVMKINGHESKKVIYEFRGFRPLVYAREVNNPVW